MATIIPRVDPSQVRDPAPLANVRNRAEVRAPNDAYRATMGLLGQANDIYQQHQEKANATAYQEAQVQISQWENHWNDPNNPDGVNSYRGRDALKLGEVMSADYDKLVSRIESGLPSDEARQKFRNLAALQREDMIGRANARATTENDRFMAETHQAYLETSRSDIIEANLTDPARAAKLYGVMVDSITSYGIANGWPRDKIQFAIATQRSAIHAGVVDRMVVSDSIAAKNYLAAHADQMLPEARAQYELKIKPLVEDAQAEAAVDDLNRGQADAIASGSRGGSGARGEANNNPGNIVAGAGFQGETGTDGRFAVFDTPEAGIRALALNARNYQRLHGLDTVQDIVARWAPPSENDTAAYVAAVAKRMSVDPGAKLNLENPETLAGLTRAIIEQENGRQPYSPAQIKAGVEGALGAPTAGSRGPVIGYGEQMKAVLARSDLPSTVRTRIVAKIQDRAQADTLARAERDRSVSEEISRRVIAARDAGGGNLRDVLGPDLYAYASGKDGWVTHYEEVLRQREQDVSDPVTRSAVDEALYRAALGGPAAIAGLLELNPYDPHLRLSSDDRGRLAKAQIAARAGDAKAFGREVSDAEFGRIVTDYRRQQLGLADSEIKDGKGDSYRRAVEFDRAMRTWRSQFTRDNKREPSYEEALAQADQLTLKVPALTPGAVFGMAWPNAGEVAATDLKSADQIPEKYRAQIAEALQARGVAFTDQAAVQLYLQTARAGRLTP